jgi:CRISPR-associated protein Cas5d
VGSPEHRSELQGDPVSLRVWGPHACFTRPDLKAERHTYDVITPSAARGIFDAIYWTCGMRWRIDRIWVERPVRYLGVRRAELKHTVSAKYAEAARKRNSTLGVAMEAGEDRQQRGATILRDVSYVLEGTILQEDVHGGESRLLKHQAIFRRRARQGQCFHQPYLGVREFPAAFAPADSPPVLHPDLAGEHHLGWMLYDIRFGRPNRPVFFNAVMCDGLIDLTSCVLDGERP